MKRNSQNDTTRTPKNQLTNKNNDVRTNHDHHEELKRRTGENSQTL